MRRPTLQEVRNKAKYEKLRKQRMRSQEKIVDDSEVTDMDESHIEILNKNYISKGKNLKTIDSINKSLRVSKPLFKYNSEQIGDVKNRKIKK